MPSPDRDKLRAGFSSLLSGDASEPTTTDRPQTGTEQAPPDLTKPDAAPADDGGHVRTSTGYVRESGERVYRVSIMLTKAERRRLREMAEDEHTSITDLVKRALGI